jgi:hypothetical protein
MARKGKSKAVYKPSRGGRMLSGLRKEIRRLNKTIKHLGKRNRNRDNVIRERNMKRALLDRRLGEPRNSLGMITKSVVGKT